MAKRVHSLGYACRTQYTRVLIARNIVQKSVRKDIFLD